MGWFISHIFSPLSWWLVLEVLAVVGVGLHIRWLQRKHNWFAGRSEGVTLSEACFMVGLTLVLTTDVQLEGFFLYVKWRYFKEALKHDHQLRNVMLLAIGLVILIFIAL